METRTISDSKPVAWSGQIPGLLCLWDFEGESPLRSKGKYAYTLQEITRPVSLVDDGVLSGRSIDIREGEYLSIPRADCPGLNIHGERAQVTVLAWVKRQTKANLNRQCEAIAGMWNETQRKRQYCLFLNIRLRDSRGQVSGHISGVGGPTPGEKWCVDVAIGQTPVRYDEWTFVAMTYDGQSIRSYFNGIFDSREESNPYLYPEGIFDGGDRGSDFTVGAVDRLGEIGNDFVGKLGGLAVFDRALSADEIAAIHSLQPLPGLSGVDVLVSDLRFPEGPAATSDGSLWAVELKGESLVNWNGTALKRYPVGGGPNGIAVDRDQKVWFCDSAGRSVRRLDPVTGSVKTIINAVGGVPLDKPNDLAFDPAGNLLFTCPGESRTEPTGYAAVLMQNGTVKRFTEGKYFPNGLAFAADGITLVLAETYRHRLWKGHWDSGSGQWSDAGVWAELEGPDGPGGPDGLAFGSDGNLYVAVYGTGYIHVVSPEGKVIKKIRLPGLNPTNCAFATDPEGGLIVTEAENGQMLRIQMKTKGIALFN